MASPSEILCAEALLLARAARGSLNENGIRALLQDVPVNVSVSDMATAGVLRVGPIAYNNLVWSLSDNPDLTFVGAHRANLDLEQVFLARHVTQSFNIDLYMQDQLQANLSAQLVMASLHMKRIIETINSVGETEGIAALAHDRVKMNAYQASMLIENCIARSLPGANGIFGDDDPELGGPFEERNNRQMQRFARGREQIGPRINLDNGRGIGGQADMQQRVRRIYPENTLEEAGKTRVVAVAASAFGESVIAGESVVAKTCGNSVPLQFSINNSESLWTSLSVKGVDKKELIVTSGQNQKIKKAGGTGALVA